MDTNSQLKTWLHLASIKSRRAIELNSITEYFEPLMEFLLSLAEEEQVILVGHSFGRLCISVAMELFPTKIAAAVFDKTPRGIYINHSFLLNNF